MKLKLLQPIRVLFKATSKMIRVLRNTYHHMHICICSVYCIVKNAIGLQRRNESQKVFMGSV